MYKESRPIPEVQLKSNHAVATNPDYWSGVFSAPARFSAWKSLGLMIDKRWTLIRRHCKRGGRVLDAGCGLGDWVVFLNRRGFPSTGLDYSLSLVQKLKREFTEIEWVQGTIEKMPFRDGTFSSVVSWGVIEHNEAGPDAALAEFHRVLEPGGTIVVTVPVESRGTIAASHSQFPDVQKVIDTGKVGFFQYFMSVEELCGFVRQADFQILDAGPVGAPSIAIIFPNFYVRVIRYPRVFYVLNQLVKILYFWKKDAANMIYCVARRG